MALFIVSKAVNETKGHREQGHPQGKAVSAYWNLGDIVTVPSHHSSVRTPAHISIRN